jgi:hypothetical protein
MHKAILLLTLICYSSKSFAQINIVNEDSVRHCICTIVYTDQLYRSNAMQQKVDSLRKANNTAFLNNYYNLFEQQDSINFTLLKQIIKNHGFPRMSQHDTCVYQLLTVLIHWSKEYPEQFNSPEMVALFKREVDQRRLSRYTLDMAIYFYVSYMPVNMAYLELINNARLAYGLPLYTKDEYMGKATIDFDLQKMNADVLALAKE